MAASCSSRSCSSSLSWSSRRFYISGKHPSFTMQPNSAVETSLRLSRAQSSEHWRLSSSDPIPQPFVRVAAKFSQKVRSFSSFPTKGDAESRARDEANGRRRVSKALRERGGKPGKRRGGRFLTDGALDALAAGHIHAALLQFHAALADHALGRPDALPPGR